MQPFFDFSIAILWILWFVYWQISAVKANKTVRNNNWWKGILIRGVIIIIVALFLKVPVLYQFVLGLHAGSIYNSVFISSIGLFIAILGFALSIWARIALGKNWGMPMTLREKPVLVTWGPYAFIRHPIYTGVIISMFGTTLITTIFWIIPFICVSAYFIYSLTIEEREMVRQFPKEYTIYKKRTKALIPFIY